MLCQPAFALHRRQAGMVNRKSVNNVFCLLPHIILSTAHTGSKNALVAARKLLHSPNRCGGSQTRRAGALPGRGEADRVVVGHLFDLRVGDPAFTLQR
jgi:hypothetical protein